MKYRYSKFTGEDLDEIDLEELLSRLSDLLLSSGFDDGYAMPGEDGLSRQSLHDAIMEAILNGGMLSEETLEKLLGTSLFNSGNGDTSLLTGAARYLFTPFAMAVAMRDRASDLIVSQSLEALTAIGLVVTDEAGNAAYRPISPDAAGLVEGTEALYARSPDAVRRLIVGALPNPLTAFADAFRLRKE